MAAAAKRALEFICQWPTLRAGETRVGIGAQLILDAARHSVEFRHS